MPNLHRCIFFPFYNLELYICYVNAGTDPSLEDVYATMSPPMDIAEWHIHDPSKQVKINGLLMLAATGKENADGYR